MARPMKKAAATPAQVSRRSKPAGSVDALALLKADHAAVKALFTQYKKLCKNGADGGEKEDVAAQICVQLTIHAQVEEEIFYPALRAALVDDAILNEADVEHASARELIAEIESGRSEDQHYDAKVEVLGEYIDHHVEEEEGQMFKQARKADVNLQDLGRQMADRKDQLKRGMEQDDDESRSPSARPGVGRGNGRDHARPRT